jgi:hypothetical protein
MQLNNNLSIYMPQQSKKVSNVALRWEENKSVTLVIENGEVAVRGFVTFEVASLR